MAPGQRRATGTDVLITPGSKVESFTAHINSVDGNKVHQEDTKITVCCFWTAMCALRRMETSTLSLLVYVSSVPKGKEKGTHT